ncbi:MAG: EamA family transporter [Rhodobiaceae bacterium]|nr:EamA family transporter [Rhodobiaceae bacterium]MCC0042167.1 EamA family transporter [Rhodobiaceae bacterium]
MGSWIVSLEGTPAGDIAALALVMLSAISHAVFGVIFKGGADPYLNRGAINVVYALMALPVALFALPMPTHAMWGVLAVSFVVHLAYELFQARAFSKGAFTLVYPVARGTGPLATSLLAFAVFSEVLRPAQWLGLMLLSGAIFGLAVVNYRSFPGDSAATRGVSAAIFAAVATGIMSAVFMNVDAHGTRMATDPFTFIAWFFILGAFGTPVFAVFRWRYLARAGRALPSLRALALRGLIGALVAYLTFGSMLVATRLAKLGEIAALRETSIAFAAVFGVIFFRERLDRPKLLLIALICAGAIVVQLG